MFMVANNYIFFVGWIYISPLSSGVYFKTKGDSSCIEKDYAWAVPIGSEIIVSDE